MAVTGFQAEVLRRIAAGLSPEGGTYVAGGLALNHVLGCTRVSRDIDVFNDTGEAVMSACAADTAALRAAGYEVRMRREGAGFAEAVVSCGGEATDIQWARDVRAGCRGTAVQGRCGRGCKGAGSGAVAVPWGEDRGRGARVRGRSDERRVTKDEFAVRPLRGRDG